MRTTPSEYVWISLCARDRSFTKLSCVLFARDNRIEIDYGAARKARVSWRRTAARSSGLSRTSLEALRALKQSKSWEGESPSARSPAAASTRNQEASRAK